MNDFYIPIQFSAHFLLTNYCNAFCPHCHMSAGPHQPKNFISITDILFYLSQFDKQPNFRKTIGLNGGEIMTAYKHHSPDYIPTIIQECVKRNYALDLRTNSLWTEDNTINDTIWNGLENIDFTNYTQKISFSLSIDKFHNNETANQKLIARICNSKLAQHSKLTAYLIPDTNTPDRDRYARFVSLMSQRFITENGIQLSSMDKSNLTTRYKVGLYLNNVPFLIEDHPVGQWGRATEFGIGTKLDQEHDIYSQFDIIHIKSPGLLDANECVKPRPESINLIFTSDGMADFIVPVEKATSGVPFHDNGAAKPLSQLYPEMLAHLNVRMDALHKKYPHITAESVGLTQILNKLQHTR